MTPNTPSRRDDPKTWEYVAELAEEARREAQGLKEKRYWRRTAKHARQRAKRAKALRARR